MKTLSWKVYFFGPILVFTLIFSVLLLSIFKTLPSDNWSKGKIVRDDLVDFKTYHYTSMQIPTGQVLVTYSQGDDLIFDLIDDLGNGEQVAILKDFTKDLTGLYATQVDGQQYYHGFYQASMTTFLLNPDYSLTPVDHNKGQFSNRTPSPTTLTSHYHDDLSVFYKNQLVYTSTIKGLVSAYSEVIDNTLYLVYKTPDQVSLNTVDLSTQSQINHVLATGFNLRDIGFFTDLSAEGNQVYMAYNLPDKRNGVSYLGLLTKKLTDQEPATNYYSKQAYSKEPVLITDLTPQGPKLLFTTQTQHGWNAVEAVQGPSGLSQVKHLSNDKRFNKSLMPYKQGDYSYMVWLDYNTKATSIMVSSDHPTIIKEAMSDADVSLKRMVSSIFMVFTSSLIYGGFLASACLLSGLFSLFVMHLLKINPAYHLTLAKLISLVCLVAFVVIRLDTNTLAKVFPGLFASSSLLIAYMVAIGLVAWWIANKANSQRHTKETYAAFITFGLIYSLYIDLAIAVYLSLYNVIGKI